MAHPASLRELGHGRLGFDRRVRLEFHGFKISSDGGLLLFHELDDGLGLHDLAGEHLIDYNQLGTAEQHIKEGKIAVKWTNLSCKSMAQNEVRLQLHAPTYNFGSFLQAADLPEEIATWPLASLQTRLIKTTARVVRHARAMTFQLAEVIISRDLFHRILAAIQRLRPPPVPTWPGIFTQSNEKGSISAPGTTRRCPIDARMAPSLTYRGFLRTRLLPKRSDLR